MEEVQEQPNNSEENAKEKEDAGNISSDIKKDEDDSEDSSDKGKDDRVRSSRGLKVLSVRVRELVCENKTTTYKEVADQLIKELGKGNNTVQSVC